MLQRAEFFLRRRQTFSHSHPGIAVRRHYHFQLSHQATDCRQAPLTLTHIVLGALVGDAAV